MNQEIDQIAHWAIS